ncbi:MAG TPA: assimilatory sulfite reductase (NADPH) hemoprotein subunit [Steroidobacteraceae bacterium]|nr:assimilatory sulfite reductase (NADPH) hemoprotein subunit [Steroidobacteraceae bacterium]
MAAPQVTPVERIKAASRNLRGTIVESLADAVTGGLREDDQQLIKFHGSYQQDDRDQREERRLAKLEPAWSFMIRTRLPGGVCTPAQWLALDGLAGRYGNGTLRLTTRQAFQLHGVIKTDLKRAIAEMNAALVDSIAACGDVNRNVLASPNPFASAVHDEVHGWAVRLSRHLMPRTRAYHEIWLDGEKVAGGEESEPMYGPTYLPRKFKAAFAVPPQNDVDVFAQDLGFIAIVEQGRLVGFDLTVGGGLGATHGDSATYPRLADLLGFLTPDRVLAAAEAVVTIQRDHGDRSERKHARLKYTIADRGVDWFKGELERRAGFALEQARPFDFTGSADRFGWVEGIDGRWHLTLRIEAGRVADRGDRRLRSGLARIAAVHRGEFRLTPNQNLVVAGVAPESRWRIDALVAGYGLGEYRHAAPLARDALACVALPTCPLAMAEAERYLPAASAALHGLMRKHGVGDEPLLFRISGCPNGCSRPYLAEIALVGKAPGRYNLHLGGGRDGRRLSRLYRENVDEAAILAALEPLLAAWARERRGGEAFGDFLLRSGRLDETAARGAA